MNGTRKKKLVDDELCKMQEELLENSERYWKLLALREFAFGSVQNVGCMVIVLKLRFCWVVSLNFEIFLTKVLCMVKKNQRPLVFLYYL